MPSLSFCPKWGSESGNGCRPTPPPPPPGPELCRGPQDHSAGRVGLSPCFSCWGSQPSALWPLQDIQTPTGFAPPCLCASQHPAPRPEGGCSPVPFMRDRWGPAGARGPLTPGDKALSGSDLQPALRARQSPSPGPLRSQTGKLKAPRSRTWRRPRSPPCFMAAWWTRPSGCRGLSSKAPCAHGTVCSAGSQPGTRSRRSLFKRSPAGNRLLKAGLAHLVGTAFSPPRDPAGPLNWPESAGGAGSNP